MSTPFPYRRICIIGTSGTGKSTLARDIAGKIGAERIELDALFHGPNWKAVSDDVFAERVRGCMEAECWVVDGNYVNRAQHLKRADLIIWLDYPFRIVLSRILRRTLKRLLTKEELWNGNRESWRMAFSRDSIILWVFQTYWKRRREFPVMLNSVQYRHIMHLRFRHPREVVVWLAGL